MLRYHTELVEVLSKHRLKEESNQKQKKKIPAFAGMTNSKNEKHIGTLYR